MKRFIYRILGTLALLSAFESGVAAQSQVSESVSGPSKTGSIRGVVVNEKGQPLAGANVTVQSRHGPQTYRNVTTDSEGRFHVAGLDPVLYSVGAHYPTYVFQPDPARQPSDYRIGDSVTITLIKGGVITGTVTSASGDPLVLIRVNAILISNVNGQKYGTPTGERFTDDRGVYRFYGLQPGKYLVSAGGRNSGNYSRDGTAYESDTPTYAPSSTRDTAIEISVLSGEETSGVDIRYRAEPGYVISGTVNGSSEGKTPSQTRVMLSPISRALHLLGVDVQHADQNPDGRRFSFSNIADGDYELIATSATGFDKDVAISDPKRITVKGADVTGLELITKPLGSISGRLVLENSTEPTCKDNQRPLFTETVVSIKSLKDVSSNQILSQLSSFRRVTPDKAGDFSFSYLTAGQYGFDVQSYAKHWYLRAITYLAPSTPMPTKRLPANKPVDAATNWITLKSGDRLTGLSITLAEGAALLRGTITTLDEQKLPARLMVHLVPAEPDKRDEVLRYYSDKVKEDGSFSVANVAPGRYWAVTRVAPETSWEPAHLRRPDQIETRRKLWQEAEKNNHVIELSDCQNLVDVKLKL